MIPSKDAKEMLYKLFAERFIALQVCVEITETFIALQVHQITL